MDNEETERQDVLPAGKRATEIIRRIASYANDGGRNHIVFSNMPIDGLRYRHVGRELA